MCRYDSKTHLCEIFIIHVAVLRQEEKHCVRCVQDKVSNK